MVGDTIKQEIMKQLHPTNLFAVHIDSDAKEIQLTHHAVAYKSEISNLPIDTNGFRYIEIGLGVLRNFKILGYVTKEEISFDTTELIDCDDFPVYHYGGEVHPETRYWDFEQKQFQNTDSNDSFYSLMHVNEQYFENPLQDEWDEVCIWGHGSNITYEDYKTAQSKVSEKYLIIEQVNKHL